MNLPRLKMLIPCRHYRYTGKSHGCAIPEIGECKPIQAGPDLSGCPRFHGTHGVKTPPPLCACPHFGGKLDAPRVPCLTCVGTMLDTFACEIYGRCTPKKPAAGIACCAGCPHHPPRPDPI